MQDLEYQDRPSDGIEFMDTVLGVLAGIVIASLAVVAAWGAAFILYGFEPEVTAAHVAEAQERKAIAPCDFTAIQYGPYHQRKDPECVGKGGPLPRHILTLPIEVRK